MALQRVRSTMLANNFTLDNDQGLTVGSGNNLYIDTVNNRVGINTNTPTHDFTVSGNIHATGNITASGDIQLGDSDADTITIGAEIGSDILPDITSTYDLGSAAKVWAEVHATTFYGDGSQLTGIAATLNDILTNGNTSALNIDLTGGTVTATSFIGDGSQLTGLASTLDEVTTNGATTTNALTVGDLTISSTNAIGLPVGTTVQRPTAANGLMRFNSTLTEFEGYNGTEWGALGGGGATYSATAPTTNLSDGDLWFDTGTTGELYVYSGTEWLSVTGSGNPSGYYQRDFTGDNSTTAFNASGTANSDVFVYANGVLLTKTSDYTYASGTVTFVTAPATGVEISVFVFGATSSVTLSSLGLTSTTNLSEGTNLYYTDARSRASISATGSLSYDNSTGIMSFTMPAQTTTAITEGTNLYYTAARDTAQFNTDFTAKTTTGLTEGTNLYYTDARADARITAADTDALSEGSTNLYYTDARVDTKLAAGVGNIITTGYMRGPASFVIDPAAHGDDTGTVVIAGNLQVDGVQTTINSTTVSIDDLNFSIATDAADSAAANGAGITVGGAGATLNYTHATTSWDMNKPLNVTGDVTVNGAGVGDNGLFVGPAGYAGSFVYKSSGDAEIAPRSGKHLIFADSTGGTELVRIKSAGGLDVTGDIGVTGTVDGVDIAARDAVLTSTTTTAGAALPKAGGTMTGVIAGFESTGIDDNASSTSITLLGSGTVGVGGTSSSYGKLTITQSTDASNGGLGIVDSGNVLSARLFSTGTAITLNAGNTGTGKLVLNAGGGNVGIGTNAPFSDLHLQSGHATPSSSGNMADNGLTISNGAGGRAVQIGVDDANARSYIQAGYVNNADVANHLSFLNGANESMRIQSGGNIGIGTAAPTEKLEVAGTAKADQYLLDAIDTDISDTAVDVFVYDTRKDSDGGAWRKRTQNTSWYNETLNTATRGSRKEFPAVAVIVAEAQEVTIYDGDDPDMPMWMVFDSQNNTGNALVSTGDYRNWTSVQMLNGRLAVGMSGTGGTAGTGIDQVDFIIDGGWRIRAWYSSQRKGTFNGNVAQRRDATFNDIALGGLVHDTVNDIAMTVLPNSPINSATGLPVPTIAVATNGGVCVIKDDGTVIDKVTTDAATYSATVDFTTDGYIIVTRNNYSYYVITDLTTASAAHPSGWPSINYFRSNVVATPGPNGPPSNPHGDQGYGLANKAISLDSTNTASADTYGLNVFDINRNIPSTSNSVAYITSSYNTGWMNGDIKLATLSDTDTTNLGTELVTNGTFTSDVSGWNAEGSFASFSSVSGQAVLVQDSNSNSYWTYQEVTVVPGKSYRVSIDVISITNTSYFRIGASGGGSNTYASYDSIPAGTGHTRTFTVPAGVTSVFINVGVTISGTIVFDNVSMKEDAADRSVNGNGLQVFGTVTKTAVATGAELMGYSGFSSSNYLRQPYNTALNFGTGSYTVMGWFKTDATNSTGIITQNGPSDTDENLIVYIAPANYGIYFDYGVGNQYSHLSQATDRALIANTAWHHFVCHVSAGGAPKIYVDGVDKALTVVGNAPSTFTFDTDYLLNIGNGRGTDNNLPFGGSIALLRISATVPSSEQIKKIYNDEKFLFQENAKATLYGSSDAVTALAYDDDTELLHAGTSAGRSVFQGLRRIDNTTDAVGAAISASNGMVAEE